MLRDEPYDEFKTTVQYPPGRPCGSDPIDMYGGEGSTGAGLARQRLEYHRSNGATTATVYRRTWVPGPWVAVDPQPKECQT
jgi:hypothetical protein